MPTESNAPMILVGPGTGIAPFRGFWHHRLAEIKRSPGTIIDYTFLSNRNKNHDIKFVELEYGKVYLFFGCRQRNLDLYRQEKEEMVQAGVLDKVFLALSREPGLNKVPKSFFNNLYNIYRTMIE